LSWLNCMKNLVSVETIQYVKFVIGIYIVIQNCRIDLLAEFSVSTCNWCFIKLFETWREILVWLVLSKIIGFCLLRYTDLLSDNEKWVWQRVRGGLLAGQVDFHWMNAKLEFGRERKGKRDSLNEYVLIRKLYWIWFQC